MDDIFLLSEHTEFETKRTQTFLKTQKPSILRR